MPRRSGGEGGAGRLRPSGHRTDPFGDEDLDHQEEEARIADEDPPHLLEELLPGLRRSAPLEAAARDRVAPHQVGPDGGDEEEEEASQDGGGAAAEGDADDEGD